MRQIRGERLQEITEDASSALRLASSSAASFPEKNECPGTHCSLIEWERDKTVPARSSREMEKRIDGESDRRRRNEKWQTCWCCRDQQRTCRIAQASAEKLEPIGPAEKERVASVPQIEQLARMPEPPRVRKSRLCQKEKEQSRQSRVPDREVGDSQGEQEPHLGEREREIKAGAWRGKGRLHSEGRQVPRRKGRVSKESLPRRSRRKHERVSGRKSSPGRSAESWFHSKFGQT